MIKNIVTFIFVWFSVASLYANDTAYIKYNNKKITVGNGFIERVIEIKPEKTATTQIINKLSGTIYNVNSDEFELEVVFSGMGRAYSKQQNGENPVILTSADFQFEGYEIKDLGNEGKELILKYSFINGLTAFTLSVFYEVYPNNNYMRKYIAISDSSYGMQFLNKIFLESITFKEKDFSHGQFGQPVFNKDIFLGVEYPTAESVIENNKIRVGYIVGQKIEKEFYKTHTSVIGVAPSATKLEQTFMEYVDEIKVKGTRQFLLYNSWYDFRNPSLVSDSESVTNEKNILHRISTFKQIMYDKYKIALDAFVLDEGWDNYKSVWEIDSSRIPNGFTPFVNALNEMHTSLGMWASPFCGYENRDIRVKWGFEHGYEKTGDFLCFAGTKYKAEFKRKMIGYAEKYNIGYFKFDGFLIACNELNHRHLPGIFSREAFVSTYINVINSVREINPDIFINLTIGTWLSPWWLKYADCIWMQGSDYGYVDNVPSINDRDKAITYKDGILWDDLRDQNLLFPMSSLMTHGIIKGKLNLLGGENESLDSFCNEVMMYFGRGVMMWELYVSPDLLSPEEWNTIASSIKWAKANKSILEKTKMILGNPIKGEVYGYLHMRKDKGILLLRNPNVYEKDVKFFLSPDLGDIDSSATYYIKIIYPYNLIIPKPVKLNQEINIHLNGYEVLTAELIPTKDCDNNLPIGIRYSIDNENNIVVFGKSGSKQTIKSVDEGKNVDVNFGGLLQNIYAKQNSSVINNANEFISTYKLTIPANYKNTRIAFLLEPDKNIQSDSYPKTEIIINGTSKQTRVEEENGKWFWIFADLDSMNNDVTCKINLTKEVNWKTSCWIFTDEELSSKTIGSLPINGNEIIPARPYPANIQKEIIFLK